MDNHQLVNQTSGKTEWYTPFEIIEAARRTMGGIDLDTASSAAANEVVKAGIIYARPHFTIEGHIDTVIDGKIVPLPVRRFVDLGGLSRPWFGRMFQNHPFGNPEKACRPGCKKKGCVDRGWHTAADIPGNADWIRADVAAYRRGEVEQAVIVTFAALSEQWFRPLLDFPILFPFGRIQYIDPDTGRPANGVTKGSCVTYLGQDVERFAYEYRELGKVHVPYSYHRQWVTAVERTQ